MKIAGLIRILFDVSVCTFCGKVSPKKQVPENSKRCCTVCNFNGENFL